MTTQTTETTLPTYEEAKATRKARIAEWFAKHHATREAYTLEGKRPIERLTWKQPNTGNYAIVYLSVPGVLTVFGDLEEAVYQAHGDVGFEFWAKCNLSYFASKCLASRSGRGFEVWDPDEARRYIESMVEQMDSTEASEFRSAYAEHRGDECLSSQQEWWAWLNDVGYEVFGSDYWEYGSIGMVVDQCCEAHLVGLKLALAQLNAGAS